MASSVELPKFDALREHIDKKIAPLAYGTDLAESVTPVKTWIDKLEEWSKGVLADLGDAERELSEARDECEMYERAAMESEGAEEAYNTLVEALQDFDRGIRDWREVQDLLPDPMGEHERGDPWQRTKRR